MRHRETAAQRSVDMGQELMHAGDFHRAHRQLRSHVEQFGWCRNSAHMLGIACLAIHENDDAIVALGRAISFDATSASAWSNLGLAYYRVLRFDEAHRALSKAKELSPTDATVLNNLGLACKSLGDYAQASKLFQEAIVQDADYADAISNLGGVLSDMGEGRTAIQWLERARALRPDRADFVYNLAKAYYACREQNLDDDYADRAVELYREALTIDPKLIRAYHNLGGVFRDRWLLQESAECFRRVLTLDPEHAAARAFLLHCLGQMCAWDEMRELDSQIETLGTGGNHISPWAALAWEDNPKHQKLRSINWARHQYGNIVTRSQTEIVRTPSDRVRIGYFSSDFHPTHATMQLFEDVLRNADRNRFEIHLFSYGRRPFSTASSCVTEADYIHDLRGSTLESVVALADSVELDIAIDLKGYTEGCWIEPFAIRIAPIQIGFLGYPGTSGASFMDYLIVDPIVLPEQMVDESITERPIYLPCYQPNKSLKYDVMSKGSRADHQLPQEAFIFCGFNAAYKISRQAFHCWVEILHQASDSVLWLLETNPHMRTHLIAEAARMGIDPSRLIFAQPSERQRHLARLSHADLFLDTFHVNGHTTASDALRVGLPVLTKPGRQLASRVASSLLSFVGLPELICGSESEYIEKATGFALDRSKACELQDKLKNNILTSDLFQPERFATHLEAAYIAVYESEFGFHDPDVLA